MAFTSTDLANVESAIIALARGTRVVSVDVNGKSINYGQADISKLESLRETIKSDIASALTTVTTGRFVRISTDKGL